MQYSLLSRITQRHCWDLIFLCRQSDYQLGTRLEHDTVVEFEEKRTDKNSKTLLFLVSIGHTSVPIMFEIFLLDFRIAFEY